MAINESKIRKIMKVECCDREKAERFFSLSEKLIADDFTPEVGREVYAELEALRNSL
jgi:hypothetical protein